MMKAALKTVFQRSWRAVPVSARGRLLRWFVGGITDADQFALGLPTVRGLLENVRAAGFAPSTIVDVGANVGNWSRMAAAVFPHSHFYMFDANADNEPSLARCHTAVGAQAEYAITLLGSAEHSAITFYKLGTGSSVLPELTSFERTAVTLPMRTLDGYMRERPYLLPMLLKLDVQGFELEVLRGAPTLLQQAEIVILEASLLPYNEGAPLLGDVIAFMADKGFAAFDFCGQARRQSDRVLFQLDVAFAKVDSALRAPRKFWLHEP